jgi:hypothetical protein
MIKDTDGNVLYSVDLSIESEEAQITTIQIECRDGYSLFGEAVDDMTVEARHGTSGSWTDLSAGGSIDLTPWDGDLETFQIQTIAGVISEYVLRGFTLTMRRPTV